MSAYVNTVSDKLYFFSYPYHVRCCITSKEGKPKFYRKSDPGVFVIPELNETIFSSRNLIHCNNSFVLCPTGSTAEESASYYSLNYPAAVQLNTQPLDETIQLVYANRSASVQEVLKPEHFLDFQVLHTYKKGLSRSNALYFSIIEDQMLIRAYSASRLVFANRYTVNSADEVFYFVMYAVEQLELDLSSIHFEFIGPEVLFDIYSPLFKDHLPKLLRISNYLVDTDLLNAYDLQLFDEDWFAAVTIQCV